MLLHGQPPPGDWQTGDHDIAVTLLFRTLLHPDIHELEVIPLRLEPEVYGILLFGFVLIVEDSVGEPAIAFHAADALDLLRDEVEVGVELGIMEHEGAVLAPLIDRLLYRGVHILLREALGRPA